MGAPEEPKEKQAGAAPPSVIEFTTVLIEWQNGGVCRYVDD